MRFNVFGRFQLDVEREGEAWVAYRVAGAVRRADHDIRIPAHLDGGEIKEFLADVFHELAEPGESVSLLN
jgi:hypothetical protein